MTSSTTKIRTSNGEAFSGYLAVPDGPARYAVVLLQEIFGINANMRAIAGDDHLCPAQAQAAIKDALAPLRDRITIVEHPGVSHGFARRGADMFDEAAAERADQATARFLDAALAGER